MGVQAFSLTQSNENYILNSAIKGKRSKLVNKMIEYYRYTDIEKFEAVKNLRASRDALQAQVLKLDQELTELRANRGEDDASTPHLKGLFHRIFDRVLSWFKLR